MRILFIGDVYGEPGRKILKKYLPILKKKYNYNFLIVNGENSCNNGRGISLEIYKEFMNLGVNCITMGNHTYGNKELDSFIEDSNVIRPANFYETPGKGYRTFNYNNKKITVINVMGRAFLNIPLECPFKTCDNIIKDLNSDYIIVDIHAEATSEKVALGWYLDGRVSAVVGTHTHIQTADERLLNNNTLYITDVGMTGPRDEIIGVSKEIVITRFLKGYSGPNKVVDGPRQLNGVILDLDKDPKIERITIID